MPATTVSRDWLDFKDEDYSDCVCLLLPKGQATLVDADVFEWASGIEWGVMGRTIFYAERWPVSYMEMRWYGGKKQRRRIPARTTMHSLHRMVFSKATRESGDTVASSLLCKRHVDHINRNPWDQRRANLRIATSSQNGHNRAKLGGKSSRFKGVCRTRKGRWVANVTLRGKSYYLGSFTDETEAAIAYNRFVAEHCGEFAYLNPITALPSDEPGKAGRRRRKVGPKPPRKPREPVLGEDGKPMSGFEWFKYLLRLDAEKREASGQSARSLPGVLLRQPPLVQLVTPPLRGVAVRDGSGLGDTLREGLPSRSVEEVVP